MPNLNPNVGSIHILLRDGIPIRAYEERERGSQDLSLLRVINVGGAYSLENIPLYKCSTDVIPSTERELDKDSFP